MEANPLISSFQEMTPIIHPDAFVDISARIIGATRLAEGASVWPMAVLRADGAEISVGSRGAVLDLALLDAPEGYPVCIGENSLVSHGAVIHGAKIEHSVLVGIHAIVLDGAVVSSGSIVGANSLVTAGTVIPPNSLVLGTPGKVVRETTPRERENVLLQVEELFEKSRLMMRKQER